MIRTLSRYLFVVYLLVVFFLLVKKPSVGVPQFDIGFWGIPSDKVSHTLLFIPYMILHFFARRAQPFIILFFLGIFVCSMAEGLHYFVPYRDFSLYDFLANLVGLSLGSLIFFKKA